MKKIRTGYKNQPKNLLAQAVVLVGAATAVVMAIPSASAVEKERANLSYNIFIGGIKMFRIGLQTTVTRNSYSSYMKLKPKGLAKLFANVSMVMSASGRLEKNNIKPQKFSFFRQKKKKKRTSEVVWTTSGKTSTSRTYKVGSRNQASLSKAIATNVPDPLSAFLRVGITNAKRPCGKSQRVYDGGKIYDLNFTLLEKTVLKSKSTGAYGGPAYKCRVRHLPVAGYSGKALAKAKKNPAVFTIWFAPVKSAILKKQILLPVAASGKIKGRAFSAVIKTAKFAGRPL